MKSIRFLWIALTLLSLSCKKKEDSGKNSAMEMDLQYANDKNSITLTAKDTIRLDESMKRFEDHPNIMQADIDAGKRIEHKHVQYVKAGDKIRISESETDDKKTK